MGGRFLPLAAQVWARDLLARYRPVSAGLFRPHPGEIYDDLSQGLQCPVLEAGELNHQARCAGELRVRTDSHDLLLIENPEGSTGFQGWPSGFIINYTFEHKPCIYNRTGSNSALHSYISPQHSEYAHSDSADH